MDHHCLFRKGEDEHSCSRPPRRAQRASADAARGEGVPASGRRGFGAQPQVVRMHGTVECSGAFTTGCQPTCLNIRFQRVPVKKRPTPDAKRRIPDPPPSMIGGRASYDQ